MCEKFEAFEENDVIKKEKLTVSNEMLYSRHHQIQEKVENIHEKERKQQVTDFLIANKKVGENANLAHEAVVDCLIRHVEKMQNMDSTYSLWDETIEDINTIITVYQQNDQNRKKEKATIEIKTVATNLKDYILQGQQRGKTTLQIMETILEQASQGVLEVPEEKIAQYKKLLALSNNSESTADKAYINEIINLSDNALLDEGSFENIVLSIYEDERISELTKIQIQQQFNIKPIQTGGDLRNALNNRNQAIEQHENKQETLNKELKGLTFQEKSLDQKLDELNTQLEFSFDSEKRAQLSQEIQLLEEELQTVKEQKKSLNMDSYTLKQVKPIKDIYLRGHKARLNKDVISIKNPLKSDFIQIPIEANNKDIGEIANTLFLYQTLEDFGGAKLIFPDEKFGKGHLPSVSMIRFSNEILAAMNLKHSGAILSTQDMEELALTIKQLQNPENTTYTKSKTDAFKEDFNELGLLDDGQLIQYKFLEKLETMAITEEKNSIR